MRSTVCPILNLWMNSVIADLAPAQGTRLPSLSFSNGGRRLFAHPPKLIAVIVDGRFDDGARQLVRRITVGRDGADRPPGTELIRQPTADQIAAERPQVGTCFRLEDENSHHTTPLAVTWPPPPESNSATAKLVALRRPTDRRRPLVLVAKDHAALFQVIGRNFDGHPIAGQRFDPVFLHPAGGIGDQRMSVVELHAVARVGQNLGDQSLELQEFFFRHVTIPLNGRSNAARGRRRRAPPVPGDAGRQPKRCRLRFPAADRYAPATDRYASWADRY